MDLPDIPDVVGTEPPDPVQSPFSLPQPLEGTETPVIDPALAQAGFDPDTAGAATAVAMGKVGPNGAQSSTPPPVPEQRELRNLVQSLGFNSFYDIAQARNYVTNRLLQLSTSRDEKIAIKALELLGKHNDIGLFTERSEVVHHHSSSADLENSIRERIKRLAKAEVIDVVPTIRDVVPESEANVVLRTLDVAENEADAGVVTEFLKELGVK